MSSSPPVYILVPAFKNIEVAAPCISSYLSQDYPSLYVAIYDNSFSEGYTQISDYVQSLNDERITYHPNLTNIGAIGNYLQLFSTLPTQSFSIVLSADMALAPNAVSTMVASALSHNASIVLPQTFNYDYNSFDQFGYCDFKKPLGPVPTSFTSTRFVDSRSLLSLYFSERNIDGSFFDFSWPGALVDSSLYKTLLPQTAFLYGPKGGEQCLSMILLTAASGVLFLEETLLHNFYGQPRLGGTERNYGDLGRLNTLLSCEDFITRYQAYLFHHRHNVSSYHFNLFLRCMYYVVHYRPLQPYILFKGLRHFFLSILKSFSTFQ